MDDFLAVPAESNRYPTEPMKYFTRQLYDAYQPGPGTPEADAAISEWRANGDDYRDALAELTPKLDGGFAWLAGTSLHDGVVRRVWQPDSTTLEILVDAANNPWGYSGLVCLRFHDLVSAIGLDDIADDTWLYEELGDTDDGISLCVLLDDSELQIVADDLVVLLDDEIPNASRPPNANGSSGTPESD